MTATPMRDRSARSAADAALRGRPSTTHLTSPASTRSLDMLLLHEELARAQIAERHAELAQSVRLARLAAARRRQRREASARRRARLAIAIAR